MQDTSGQAGAGETTATGEVGDTSSDAFYAQPILNAPYEYPGRHWELDESNRPTNRIVETRRPSAYVSPIPKPAEAAGAATDTGHGRNRQGGDIRPPAVRPDAVHQRRAASRRTAGRRLPERRLAGDAGNCAPAAALAPPRVRRHATVLLPGRGGRDRDLADGGRAKARQGGARVPRTPGRRQQPSAD